MADDGPRGVDLEHENVVIPVDETGFTAAELTAPDIVDATGVQSPIINRNSVGFWSSTTNELFGHRKKKPVSLTSLLPTPSAPSLRNVRV